MPTPLDLELEWRSRRYADVRRGLDAVATQLERNVDDYGKLTRDLLSDYMKGVVRSVRQRVSTPWPSGTSPAGQFPGTLSKRRGRLAAQFADDAVKISGSTARDLIVEFQLSGVAAVHERGATVRPRKATYLTIPLTRALDKRGVPLRRRARDWKNTFVARSKRGNLLIFLKERDGSITPLYALKKQVVIPRRLAFDEAFRAGRDLLADKLAESMIREFNRG